MLEDLSRPAVTEVSGVELSTSARLLIGWLRETVRRVLQEELGCPVRLELAPARAGGTRGLEATTLEEEDFTDDAPPVFGIHVRPGGEDETNEACVTLDEDAARSLVDPLEEQLSGLQRVGDLTHTERGLLEYLTLTCLTRILSVDNADPERRVRDDTVDHFSVRGFLDERETAALLSGLELSPVRFRLTVAGRVGAITLWLPQNHRRFLCSRSLDALPASDAMSPSTRRVSARLALPPVAITKTELRRLQPRDVILLGVTSLESFAAPCSLVTTTGWRLSEARISSDTPTTTAVSCGPLQPEVMSWPAPQEGETLLQTFLGSAELTISQLEAWEDGGTLDLRKSSGAPVSLHEGGVCLGTGELVRVQGEIGVRLLHSELTT